MSTEILLEIGESEYPNHVYVLQEGQMIAYWQRRDKSLTIMCRPIFFSKKNRKFKNLSAKQAKHIQAALNEQEIA